jgi:hypothetical protein
MGTGTAGRGSKATFGEPRYTVEANRVGYWIPGRTSASAGLYPAIITNPKGISRAFWDSAGGNFLMYSVSSGGTDVDDEAELRKLRSAASA